MLDIGKRKHLFQDLKKKIIIIGAGGHAKVVLDAIIKTDKYHVIGFADDSLFTGIEVAEGYFVIADTNSISSFCDAIDYFIVAVGDNRARASLYQSLKNDYDPATIIHPDASIANNAVIGAGSVVLAQAVINSHVKIGENCLINSLSLIDHGCVVGEHTNIAQGTIIGSDVHIPPMYISELGEKIPAFSQKRSSSY